MVCQPRLSLRRERAEFRIRTLSGHPRDDCFSSRTKLLTFARAWRALRSRALLVRSTRTANAKARLQLLAITAAHPQAGSIFEQYFIFSVFAEPQAPNSLQVHDRRAMNPAKRRRVQIALEFAHAAAQ